MDEQFFKPGVEEPGVKEPEPVVKEVEPTACVVTPETADIVFDAAEADLWLKKVYMRRTNVFRSIRLEPEDMPEKHLALIFKYVVGSLRPVYTPRFTEDVCRGVLFVPTKLANDPAFEGLERGKKFGKYTAFYK